MREYSSVSKPFDEQVRDVLLAMQEGHLSAEERSALIHTTTQAHYAIKRVRSYIADLTACQSQ